MAAGRAIVATSVGGTPGSRRRSRPRPPRPTGDVHALAAAIRELLQDAALREELGRNARDRQQAELDLDAMVRRIEALYRELLRG